MNADYNALSVQAILSSAGFNYLTMPAVADLLSAILTKIPLKYLSEGDAAVLSTKIAQELQTELGNRVLNSGDIIGTPLDFLGGAFVDAIADAVRDSLAGKAPAVVVELTRYGVEIAGNAYLASARTGNLEAGAAAGLIEATAGEVTDALKAGLGLWLDVQAAKDEITKINQMLDDTERAAQAAKSAGDIQRYKDLEKVEIGLLGAKGTLSEFVASPLVSDRGTLLGSIWQALSGR